MSSLKIRLSAFLLLLISVVFLAGFSFGEVHLTVQKPLIDLQETVQKSSFGDEDTYDDTVPEDAQGQEDPSAAGKEDPDDAQASEGEQAAAQKEVPKKHTIRIQETRIFLDNASVSSGKDLVNRLNKLFKEENASADDASAGKQLMLVDDFADYRTYLEVREALDEADIAYSQERTP